MAVVSALIRGVSSGSGRGLGVAGRPSVHGQCVRSVRARGHRTSSRTLSAASTTPRESITTPETRPTISAAPGRLRLEQSQHSRPEELRTEAVRTASYGGTDLARPPRTQGAALTILVTGATGTVGRALVHALSERGQSVRALSRDPSTAVLPTGVEVVQRIGRASCRERGRAWGGAAASKNRTTEPEDRRTEAPRGP